jgi:sulfate/thiosulfate-binding protein
MTKKIILSLMMAGVLTSSLFAKDVELLNVSYDPTREVYRDINPLFIQKWKKQTGEDVKIKQSHGGSGKQARAVIDGLEADVVTLALAYDVDAINEKGGLISKGWIKKLPHNSSPYTSTIVFVVRKGNPKNIKDWNDLVKPGVTVITPNPKTSGGARWNFLAAWAYAFEKTKNEAKTQDFLKSLFNNVPILDSGARGSTTTFMERGIGDVLLAWENEALLIKKNQPNDFQIIYPSISIKAEPSVAVVDKNAAKHGSQKAAEAYLRFLYTPEAQSILVNHGFRPSDPASVKTHGNVFPKLKLVTIDSYFGGWAKAQAKHFADGGSFDKIYEKNRR